jgi:hypothetical protein
MGCSKNSLANGCSENDYSEAKSFWLWEYYTYDGGYARGKVFGSVVDDWILFNR